ncbi:hypothetical protein [Oscillibacter sp.]|uniref:hypothetical protein n=1 Tax=Oscillibacter sp. TaxID=1945593 RepID=UPI001B488D30|nr:hypothetical protein [Oscillibacter sp.]MBP3509193.1 hypothetical protein [Oscillibacter sp.]
MKQTATVIALICFFLGGLEIGGVLGFLIANRIMSKQLNLLLYKMKRNDRNGKGTQGNKR